MKKFISTILIMAITIMSINFAMAKGKTILEIETISDVSDETTEITTVDELTTDEDTTEITTVNELTTDEDTTEITTVDELTTDEDTTEITTVDEFTTDEDTSEITTMDELTTDEESTETTTIIYRRTGGGGGGSSSVKRITTTTESTTEVTTNMAVKEEVAESTTEILVLTKDVKVSVGSNKVIVGEESYIMDAAAYIQIDTNSTMVPLRFVAIAICGDNIENADNSNAIKWDGVTKTATISTKNNTIKFTADSNKMDINGEVNIIDNGVKAEIKDGRMYIPFRALGKAIGVNVDWDADTKTAIYKVL